MQDVEGLSPQVLNYEFTKTPKKGQRHFY